MATLLSSLLGHKRGLMMKKALYLGASMLAVAAAAIVPASAADMYRAEAGGYKDGPGYYGVSNWTGFYAGVNGGYGWSDAKNQLAFSGNAPSAVLLLKAALAAARLGITGKAPWDLVTGSCLASKPTFKMRALTPAER